MSALLFIATALSCYSDGLVLPAEELEKLVKSTEDEVRARLIWFATQELDKGEEQFDAAQKSVQSARDQKAKRQAVAELKKARVLVQDKTKELNKLKEDMAAKRRLTEAEVRKGLLFFMYGDSPDYRHRVTVGSFGAFVYVRVAQVVDGNEFHGYIDRPGDFADARTRLICTF